MKTSIFEPNLNSVETLGRTTFGKGSYWGTGSLPLTRLSICNKYFSVVTSAPSKIRSFWRRKKRPTSSFSSSKIVAFLPHFPICIKPSYHFCHLLSLCLSGVYKITHRDILEQVHQRAKWTSIAKQLKNIFGALRFTQTRSPKKNSRST